MKKHGAIAAIIVGVGMALAGARAFAETLSVELLVDPKNPIIDLAAPQEVAIVARPIGNDAVTYRWKLEGVGKLGGGEGEAGRLYLPPQDIEGDVVQTTISVVVTDQDGNNATASVTFTLHRTPTPAPREEPSDGDYSVEDLKAKAKWNAWLNKQMRPAFEEAAALEQEDLDAADKREAWSRFLQNFAQNHPFSEEDDRMRQQAKERIAHWEHDATPTPTPPPAPPQQGGEQTSPLLNQEGTGVVSCWENATPGATCAEPTTGMEFVFVPGGCFQMGSPESEDDRSGDEGPRHKVCLDGFWMGKFEVTQAQWETVMGDNPSDFTGADRPVEQVSWHDAQAFLKQLNASVETHGRASLQFRLPSEAEWEYAARAGTTTPFFFGETISVDQANYDGNYTYGKGNKGVYREQTTDVGSFPPNDFGLYDLHGNVWEWVADTYHDNYKGAPTDGSVWGNLGDGKAKVLRGGSWYYNPNDCRSALRNRDDPDGRNGDIGARVVVGAR